MAQVFSTQNVEHLHQNLLFPTKKDNFATKLNNLFTKSYIFGVQNETSLRTRQFSLPVVKISSLRKGEPAVIYSSVKPQLRCAESVFDNLGHSDSSRVDKLTVFAVVSSFRNS